MRSLVGLMLTVAAAGCTPPAGVPGTQSPTQPPTAPPLLAIPSGYAPYRSMTAPFSICYPVGWRVEPDWMSFWSGGGDAFLDGAPGDFPQVATVTNEAAIGYDSDRYLQAVLDNLRSMGAGVERLGSISVDGVTGQLVRFARLTADQQRYTVQQVVWAKEDRGWVLAGASSVISSDMLGATLRTMASCFRSDGHQRT
jgi:hypothetical protein